MKKYIVKHWMVPGIEGRGIEIKKDVVLSADFFHGSTEIASLVDRGYIEEYTESTTSEPKKKAK